MSPSRRQVVAAVAAAGFAPTSVVSAQENDSDGDDENSDENEDGEESREEREDSQDGDEEEEEEEDEEEEEEEDEEGDGEFSPELSIRPNNLVARVGEREDDTDPDTVTVYTADGSVFEFDGAAENDWEQGDAFDVGYTRSNSRGEIEGWHGIIERVEATKDDETVSVENDGDSTLEVTCTLWKTPDFPPTEFTVISDGATKHHWNRGDDDLSEEQRQYGSPGRRLETVVEHDPEGEMRVDFGERDCYPNERKSLYFECTSVTVEEDELNQGEDRIEDVQLRFADGTYENPDGDADEADNGAFELPVTLEGTGENEGKVIENLHFKVPSGEYYYRNLDVEECRAEQNDAGDEEAGTEGEGEQEDGSEPPEDGTDDAGGESDGPDGSDDADGGAGGEDTPSTDADGGSDGGGTPEETADGSGPRSDGEGGDAGGTTETAADGPSTQESTEGGSSGGSSEAPTTDRGTAETRTAEAGADTATPEGTEAPAEDATATSTPEDAVTSTPVDGNGSAADDGTAPGLPDGEPADEQAGLGVVAALGGLFGFGELARRRLGDDGEKGPEKPE